MTTVEYGPLVYPSVWPPPALPPPVPGSWEARLKRIPILGWFPVFLIRYLRWRKHYSEVLEPIAFEITEQLEARPMVAGWSSRSHWFSTARHQKIAEIISDAVALEKFLVDSPPLHPEDPFPLLFWGPFDDLTPLTVGLEIQKEFEASLTSEGIRQAWEENWTLREFIDYCDQCISQGTAET